MENSTEILNCSSTNINFTFTDQFNKITEFVNYFTLTR